MADAAAIMI